MTKAVLVIGAGPSGMAQVNALVGAADLWKCAASR